MQPSFPLLSIDPSSTKIGWALLNAGPQYLTSGVCHIPAVPQVQRVPYVGHAVRELIQTYHPASVLIEVPDFIAKYAKQHIVWFFRAVGAVEMVVSNYGLPVFHIPASHNKGKDKKQQAVTFFWQTVGRPPLTDDESDAMANGWKFLQDQDASQSVPDDQDDYEYGEYP